jgi:hypothetical protein
MKPPKTTKEYIEFTLVRHLSELYDEPNSYGTDDEIVAWLSSFRQIAEEHDVDFDEIANGECLASSIEEMNTLVRSFGRPDLEVEIKDGDCV